METTVGRFMFQKRHEKIDWRKLASVDVDRIAQEVDVDAIQNNILNVTYCAIEHELGYHGLDINFIKLFRLAQLTIEYLLHCQEYLQQCLEERDNKVLAANNEFQQLTTEKEKVVGELKKRNEAYKTLKKELQKYKKLIGDYQLMVRAGASGLYKCTCCNKSFVSEFYLRSHIERRHPEEARRLQPLQVHYQSTVNQSFKDVELQNELNEIRSRLKITEDELIRERENMSVLRIKENERNQELLYKFKSEHDTWQLNEQKRMKNELDAYKEMMMSELKQSQLEKDVLKKNLTELQQSTGKQMSNLGDLMDADTDQRYIDLNQKIEQMGVNFQQKINEINAKHAKEKIIQSKLHEKELAKEKTRSSRAEKDRVKDQQIYEEQIQNLQQKLAKHDKLLDSKIGLDNVDGKRQSITALTPPLPPPRESTSSPAPVVGDLPEKESICLWVSTNQSFQKSHRVFRTPASTKGDWKDSLSFHALLEPVGEFQKAIYVYSCGGSPYWRQYVSESNQPPHSSYKHDLTFYVTSTKLLGTMKLHVLDSGSGSVVRSMISKEDAAEEWKNKGLTFYAMKAGPNKTSMTKSGTFNSDVFESVSDDDVSVSSFTGTDVIKQDLAEDLKRSRENLVDAVEDEEEVRGKEELLDDEEEEFEEEIVNKENKINENFTGTSSGSLLMSTLPEKGEFYPFPSNQLAVAHYNHSKDMVMAQRREIADILEDHLEKRGVDPEEQQMPTSVYKSKMKNHSKEEQLTEKTYPGFGKRRHKIIEELDEYVEETFKRKKSAKRNLNSAAGVVKSVVKFKGKENRRPLPTINRESTPEKEAQIQINNIVHSKDNAIHGNDDDGDGDDDDDEFDVSESSEWDSGDEEDQVLHMKVPAVAISQPSPEISYESEQYDQEEPYRPKMRPPQGEKVKNLAASLEASLSLRDPSKKKLAGAVDLYQPTEDNAKPKRSVSFQHVNDDDVEEEDSDFSTTSFEQARTRAPHTSTKNNDFSDDDDDIETLLAAYEPSGKTSTKPTASSTPHSSAPTSKTAVTAFNLEDFDDDDSF